MVGYVIWYGYYAIFFYDIDADAKMIQYPFDHSQMIFTSIIAFISKLRHQVINLVICSNGRMNKLVF